VFWGNLIVLEQQLNASIASIVFDESKNVPNFLFLK